MDVQAGSTRKPPIGASGFPLATYPQIPCGIWSAFGHTVGDGGKRNWMYPAMSWLQLRLSEESPSPQRRELRAGIVAKADSRLIFEQVPCQPAEFTLQHPGIRSLRGFQSDARRAGPTRA